MWLLGNTSCRWHFDILCGPEKSHFITNFTLPALPIGPYQAASAPTNGFLGTRTCIFTFTHFTHFSLKNGGNMYPQNVGNSANPGVVWVHGAAGVFFWSKYEIQNAWVLAFICGLLEIISFVLFMTALKVGIHNWNSREVTEHPKTVILYSFEVIWGWL